MNKNYGNQIKKGLNMSMPQTKNLTPISQKTSADISESLNKNNSLEKQEERRKKFRELEQFFIDKAKFSKDEFQKIVGYPWKWHKISFLANLQAFLSRKNSSNLYKITNHEILDAIEDLFWHSEYKSKYKNYDACDTLINYIFIKRNAKNIHYYSAKKVIDNWRAMKYLKDYIAWVPFVWMFHSAMVALEIAMKKWLFERRSHWHKDLGTLLNQALNEKQKKKNRK